jgi:spermidine synthase
VLDHPQVTRVQVVEIEPAIVRWVRTVLAPLNGDPLADRRVSLTTGDLACYLQSATGPYDAVLLDVDNGPGWLVYEQNAALYERPMLAQVRSLLRPEGVLAVWSAQPAPQFVEQLRALFARTDEVTVTEQDEQGRETAYFIYRALAPNSAT